ncbi:hypothetical protein [Methylorubrum aminovorans]
MALVVLAESGSKAIPQGGPLQWGRINLVSVSGSTGLAQVLPGQTLSGSFGDLSTVSLDFR